ncbi:unnamed protein product [Parascedosporium putredinis]|uniref:Uncharacterized protein n=1 Tax=Parascedosporium putredinis TaxID=1442378 RepID=A0A9P1M8Q3_9PEZI|nr:unnamed protein product [Parascedosporium putredinis]CAI7989357.1 unnamed protein product [Parascedosporium putredinis]
MLMKPALLKLAFPISQQPPFHFNPQQPKPPPQSMFHPEPRASANLPAKTQPAAVSRPLVAEQDTWSQPHPGTPYHAPDINQWQEGYHFAPPTQESIPHAQHPTAAEAVDHPMNSTPAPLPSDQMQPHTSMHQQPQAHTAPTHHQQPYATPQHTHTQHPHAQHQHVQHQHQYSQPPHSQQHPQHPQHPPPQTQQWPTSGAQMEVLTSMESPLNYEHSTRPKTPKRPMGMSWKSIDNLRLKRQHPTPLEEVPPLPSMGQQTGYEIQSSQPPTTQAPMFTKLR